MDTLNSLLGVLIGTLLILIGEHVHYWIVLTEIQINNFHDKLPVKNKPYMEMCMRDDGIFV